MKKRKRRRRRRGREGEAKEEIRKHPTAMKVEGQNRVEAAGKDRSCRKRLVCGTLSPLSSRVTLPSSKSLLKCHLFPETPPSLL